MHPEQRVARAPDPWTLKQPVLKSYRTGHRFGLG